MPKSDEQRKRLIEVSKKIMLLSRLDEVKRKFSQELRLQTINIRAVNPKIEHGGQTGRACSLRLFTGPGLLISKI